MKGLAEPSAGFLNPETGQATTVRPDPAGWPKAEVTPPAPELELPLPKAPEMSRPKAPKLPLEAAKAGAPGAKPELPLDMPKLPGAAKRQGPILLDNPETGEITRIAPDPAGWPKPELGKGPPGPLEGLLGDAPALPPAAAPKAAGTAPPPLPQAPELPGLDKPELPLAGAAKETIVEGLETGDVTSITPDPAGWPKASVTRGAAKGLSELLPELPAEPGLARKLSDQAGSPPKIPR